MNSDIIYTLVIQQIIDSNHLQSVQNLACFRIIIFGKLENHKSAH